MGGSWESYHDHEDDQPSYHSPWTQKSEAYLHSYNRKPPAEANWDAIFCPAFPCARETLRTQRISWAGASSQPLGAHLKAGPYKTTQSSRRPELRLGPSAAPPSQIWACRSSRTEALHFLLFSQDIGPLQSPIYRGLLNLRPALPPIMIELCGGGSGGKWRWSLRRRFRRWRRRGCTTSLGTCIGLEVVHINLYSLWEKLKFYFRF